MHFDLFLVLALVVLAAWEGVVAVRRKQKKRALVIVLALGAAALLAYLWRAAWLPG
jgi:hypothetical protein